MTGTTPSNVDTPIRLSPNHGLRTAVLITVLMALAACAGYEATNIDQDVYRQRALTQIQGPITISAAVPDAGETEQITGLDLYDQGIQPIWLEVTNSSNTPVRVSLWSIDSNYFSPIEVAYMNRGGLSDEGEADMQRWFYENRLQRFAAPGETLSGFVYTHLVKGTKGFNLDIFADRQAYNFTFFVPVPGFTADYMQVDFDSLYTEAEFLLLDQEDVMAFYQVLENEVACCSTDPSGKKMGEPFNLVLVGSGLAVRRSLLRGDWQENSVDDPSTERARNNRFQGRAPDGIFHKYRSDGGERKELRIWLAPGKIGGENVWLAQISYDISARGGENKDAAYELDPDIDTARRFAVQNFWYSQSIARFGMTGGGSVASIDAPKTNFNGEEYFSDGLRAVMWLSETPVAMDETSIENLMHKKIEY
jgi:hypothetical protein